MRISRQKNVQRRGMILLVVVAFLALFAILGTTYVMLADTFRRGSEADMDAADVRSNPIKMPDIDPRYMLNFVMERLLYDPEDVTQDAKGVITNSTPKGIYNPLRGHSFARNMYGWDNSHANVGTANAFIALNDKPFIGHGRERVLANSIPSAGFVTLPGAGQVPEWKIVNHTYFAGGPLIDPQRGARTAANPNPISSTWNASYTGPDFNSMFLGSYSIANPTMQNPSGITVIPSFHRSYLFGNTGPDSIPTTAPQPSENPNWINSQGKYFTLRPRPVDNLSNADAASVAGNTNGTINLINQRISESKLFPYPDADGLDVKNLEGYPGGNDSFWIDAGYPVMTTADGRKYKVLIAPLILDLDGRINLNVAGNLMKRNSDTTATPPILPEYNADHASNQGWGRWEINPQKLIAGYNIAPPGHPNNPLYVTQYPFPSMTMAMPISENEFSKFLAFTVPTNPMTEPGTTGMEKSAALNASGNQSPIGFWQNFGRFFESRYLPVNNYPPPITNFAMVNAHSYAMVDYNGAGDFQPAMSMTPPWGPTAKPTFNNPNGFPSFGNGFGNGKANEHLLDGANNNTNYHAQNFNPYRTQSGANGISSVFQIAETAAILRWQATGEPYANSKLGMLMPKALGMDMPGDVSTSDGQFRQKVRNSITTISADLDRPGIAPIIPDLTSPYSFTVRIGDFGFPERVNRVMDGNGAPAYSPRPDQPTTSNQTSPALKINLNRNLTPFPALITAPATIVPAEQDRLNYVDWNNNSSQFNNAIKDRTNLAREIYETLRNITGVIKVEEAQSAAANMATPNADKMAINTDMLEIKKSNRWLAQLAVNIVDYIDSDDYNTALQWTGDSKDWVFGVELPRVVINEVYSMAQNEKNDPFTDKKATKDTHFHTAIELLNPLPNDGAYGIAPGGHTAVLQCKDANGTVIPNYRLVLCNPNQVAGRFNAVVGNQYFNNTGALDFDNTDIAMDIQSGGKAILNDWTDAGFMPPNPAIVPPTWTLATNNGNAAMVIADDTDLHPDAIPGINSTMKSSKLKLKNLDKTIGPTDNHAPEVVLQKLIYPGLPPNDFDAMNPGVLSNPALPYNPYITVDVFSSHKIWDLRKYDSAGNDKNPMVANTNSFGRNAPYLDSAGLDKMNFNANWYNGKNSSAQNGVAAAKHTMGASNSNLANPLPWLTHLDRQLINPMELLHVSTVKPHELTQTANRWGDGFTQANIPATMMQPEVPARTTYPYANNWPWFDENTRLHRFLEVAAVTPLQAGEIQHGRILGKVNVNTMHGEEVFQAVADAAPANNFAQGDVTNAYTNMMGQRPITGFGQANNSDFSGPTSKSGLNKSLLGYKAFDPTNIDPITMQPKAELPNGNMLDVQGFAGTGASPAIYARKELLTKVGNSVTTRSNVFGVWMTTGYFEVTDDSTNPPKLGAEIGKADGVNIRHRMFAIVDRTQMTSMATSLKYTPNGGPQSQVLNAVTMNNNVETLTPLFQAPNNVSIQPGMTVAGWQGKGTNQTGRTWAFQDKMLLTFDSGTDNEETVELKLNTAANRLEATFTKPHGYGSSIINRGNPGPWSGYNYKLDTQVVPYVEFIE